MRTLLGESEQHDLRVCADAHRRSPRSHTAGCVYLHFAEALQSVGEPSEGAPRDEIEGKHLSAAVGVPGKLQADSCLFGERQAIGNMIEQNTRRSLLQLQAFKECVHLRRNSMSVWHASYAQS